MTTKIDSIEVIHCLPPSTVRVTVQTRAIHLQEGVVTHRPETTVFKYTRRCTDLAAAQDSIEVIHRLPASTVFKYTQIETRHASVGTKRPRDPA